MGESSYQKEDNFQNALHNYNNYVFLQFSGSTAKLIMRLRALIVYSRGSNESIDVAGG